MLTLHNSVCLVSIVRFYYLWFGAKSTDVTWDVAAVAMWSAIELNVAIVCSCLMVMKPLVSRFFPGLFTQDSGDENHRLGYIRAPTASSDRCRTQTLQSSEATRN